MAIVLHLFLMKDNGGAVEEVVVISGGEFKPDKKQMIQEILQRKMRSKIKIVYQIESHLWGGMVLKFGTYVVGKSLRDRLREGGFLKS